jgi:hypothetical protein
MSGERRPSGETGDFVNDVLLRGEESYEHLALWSDLGMACLSHRRTIRDDEGEDTIFCFKLYEMHVSGGEPVFTWDEGDGETLRTNRSDKAQDAVAIFEGVLRDEWFIYRPGSDFQGSAGWHCVYNFQMGAIVRALPRVLDLAKDVAGVGFGSEAWRGSLDGG